MLEFHLPIRALPRARTATERKAILAKMKSMSDSGQCEPNSDVGK